MPANDKALLIASHTASGDGDLRRLASSSAEPIEAASKPTMRTSQSSTFGPVTATKLRK
jgi:hypothetical protein